MKPPRYIRVVRDIYQEVIADRYKDQNFWILTAFIPTFIIARLVVHTSPTVFLQVGGLHIHHFTYGLVLLLISGYTAMVLPHRAPPWLAFVFGVGLALILDESGMLLHLSSHYYDETSIDITIAAAAILINLVYFRHFWLRLLKSLLFFTKR